MREGSPRRRLRSDRGMSLVEMMIALALLGIVIPVFVTTLASVQSRVGRQQDRPTRAESRYGVQRASTTRSFPARSRVIVAPA